MAILRSKEEILPVTCAVIKEQERSAFFSKIHRRQGGRPDQLARAMAVPASLVQGWIGGEANIPYHLLQWLVHEFGVDMPPVSELRRESQPVLLQAPTPARRAASPPPRTAKQAAPKPPPPRKQSHQRRPAKKEPSAQKMLRPRGLSMDPSEDLAYWVGVTVAAARIEQDRLIFEADRDMGQNFAAIWSKYARRLFAKTPILSMMDAGKTQAAELSLAGLEEHLPRLGIKPSFGLPRWVWSNATWKKACLKGIGDARGRFHRAPALVFQKMEPSLTRAVGKMLRSLEIEPVPGPDGVLGLHDAGAIERYLDRVGTQNMKLRDQLRSFLRRGR